MISWRKKPNENPLWLEKRLLADDSADPAQDQPSPAKRLLLLPSGAGATGVNARLELIIGDRAGVTE